MTAVAVSLALVALVGSCWLLGRFAAWVCYMAELAEVGRELDEISHE